MDKTVAGAALISGLGLCTLAAAPASALSFPLFEDCDAAAGAGVYNIPVGDPRHTAEHDSDSDGIVRKHAAYAYVPLPPVGEVPIGEVPQMEQVPAGGADGGGDRGAGVGTGRTTAGAGGGGGPHGHRGARGSQSCTGGHRPSAANPSGTAALQQARRSGTTSEG